MNPGDSATPRPPPSVPEHSEFWCRWFVVYLRRYFAKHFHAVRTSPGGDLGAESSARPLIVYANHPSWWDPIHFLLLASYKLPERRVYGPLDAQALEKYGFFKKLGVFGVERSSQRGAAAFLRTSLAILEQPGASLWLTAQGEFVDPRQRPIQLMPGLAHLARRCPEALVVPLAVEYPFWEERTPEAVSRFGRPIDLREEPMRSAQEWTELFTERLEQTLDELSAAVQSRDPRRFETLIAGQVGVGGIYDRWRRWKARVQGRPFQAAHGEDSS